MPLLYRSPDTVHKELQDALGITDSRAAENSGTAADSEAAESSAATADATAVDSAKMACSMAAGMPSLRLYTDDFPLTALYHLEMCIRDSYTAYMEAESRIRSELEHHIDPILYAKKERGVLV